jgi:phospholipid/cholesterol/gamma-HCH transport system substrate-binding protein
MAAKERVLASVLGLAVILSGCARTNDEDMVQVVAYFEDVGDLVDRASVQVADVEVGEVNEIELINSDGDLSARVTMTLDEGTKVARRDLQAVVRQTSLLGEQFIELVPGADGAPFLTAGVTEIPIARTDKRVDIETFLGDLAGFVGEGGLEDLNRFTHAQALILQDRGERFGETLSELETFTGVLAGRRFDIASAIDHLASAGRELADNKETLDRFLDSLETANALLAKQGNKLGTLFRSLREFGRFNSRFLADNQDAIGRQFQALHPILSDLAGAEDAIRADLHQLRVFFELFPKSFGTGPGASGAGDYVQVEAVVCETLSNCNSQGEKGDVPGEGS